MTEHVTIESLGAQGDGFAHAATGPLHVPFALPGERVAVERLGARGTLLAVEQPSADRVEPPCPHFGRCGGCELQHADAALYASFKRERVATALAREGLSAEVAPLVPCAPATRRRAVFSAVRAGNRVLFGFHEAHSNRIAPIRTCLVVLPAIERQLDALRKLAEQVIDRKRELRLTVIDTAGGLDVAAEGAAELSPKTRLAVTSQAMAAGWARLTVNGETAIQTAAPQIAVGASTVEPPPGAFLQAVAGAEGEMARHALPHLAKAKQVADLFCGVGTFTLRLAETQGVTGYESDRAALAALDRARRATAGLRPITTEQRDLFRRPVTAKELNRFGGVLFDPPRAGAEGQCRELARSDVPRVSAVSCNPVTLARDARILVDGGYRLEAVTPIDQFLWSHHVEVVALFAR